MLWKTLFLKLLKSELEKRKAKNPRFSGRQLAKKLGVSIGVFSEVLAGKRTLSPGRAIKVLKNSDLEEDMKNRLLGVLSVISEGPPDYTDSDTLRLNNDFVADWRNLVLLPLLHHPSVEEHRPLLKELTSLTEDQLDQYLSNLRKLFPTQDELTNFQIDFLLHNFKYGHSSKRVHFHETQNDFISNVLKKNQSDTLTHFMTFLATESEYRDVCKKIGQVLMNSFNQHEGYQNSRLYCISLQMAPVEGPKNESANTESNLIKPRMTST